MYSIVIQVYKFGVKRDERELANDQGRLGDISLVHFDHHPVLRLLRIGDNTDGNKLLPYLFEPTCLGLMGDGMVWRGYQRPWSKREDQVAPVFLQEWRVRVIDQAEARRTENNS